MNIKNLLAILGLAVILSACSSAKSPYLDGITVNDIPSNVDVINVKAVTMDDTSDELSQNDREVLTVIKANIMNQLANYGYKVTEVPGVPADIALSFSIKYQPDYVLVDRSVTVVSTVYDGIGRPLFQKTVMKRNNESGNLIGAILASALNSRDQMISDATRKNVIDVVDEMRKGMKNNQPVRKKY